MFRPYASAGANLGGNSQPVRIDRRMRVDVAKNENGVYTNLRFLGEGDGDPCALIAYQGRLEIDGSNRVILGPGLVSAAANETSRLTLDSLELITTKKRDRSSDSHQSCK